MSKLAELPAELQAREMLRAERLVHRQDYLGAFAVYSQFARDYPAELVTPKETVAWHVRGDHWAAGRIEELFKTAPANVKEQLEQTLAQAVSEVLAQDRPRQEQFLTLYGFHSAANEVRQKLAATLAEARDWQAAENLLLDLQSDPAQVVKATERLARLWQATDARLAAQGVRWSFSRIALANPASMAAHQRMGAQRVGLAGFLVLGPWQVAVFSLPPFVHVSLHAGSRPTVQLRAPASP